jgi:hypothetical protein
MAGIVGVIAGYYAFMAFLWMGVSLGSLGNNFPKPPLVQSKVWQIVYSTINAEWHNWLDLLMVAAVAGVIWLIRFTVQKWAVSKIKNSASDSVDPTAKWKW